MMSHGSVCVSVQGRRSIEADPVVVSFSGELDAGDPDFGADLLRSVGDATPCVIVDMLNVSFIDSSVIRGLVLAHRRAEAASGWVRVVYTHHVVRRVIAMCGLAEVFPQYPTIEAARRDLPSGPPGSEATMGRGRPQ